MDENYERVLEKIADYSGLSIDELNKKIDAKREKLAGLITKEGAMQIIASELGVSFDNEKLKVKEIIPGMRKVNVSGKVISLFPVRNFTTNKGVESKVVSFVLADETSNTRVVLWDTNHVELIEKGEIKEGDAVEILNATARNNEVHLGNFSELKYSSEVFNDVISEKIVTEKQISDFSVGDNTSVRAFIVQSFEPRFFYVCEKCKKKAVQEGDEFSCAEHGRVVPEKRALINFVIDDGTETITAVVFHDNLPSLGLTQLDNQELLLNQKEDLLGKEMVFSGSVRMNKFFNRPEFIVDGVMVMDADKLIEKLDSE